MNMTKITRKAVLSGEVGKVWKFITEPKNFPKYVYGYSDGKTTSSNATGIGASYEWYGRLGPVKLKSTEEIVKWEDKKLVAYTGKMLGIKFNSSMKVAGRGKQTRLTVSIEYNVPFYIGGVVTDWILVRWVVRDHVEKSLNKLGRIFS